MSLRTSLYPTHAAASATIVDFGGWDMPLHYGSQIQEHTAVRRDAGMFDVSHMGIVDARGARVRDYLRRLLANDVGKLRPHQALYSCMLLPTGGIIDDLIVFRMTDDWYRLVVNAGTRVKDLAWLRAQSEPFEVAVHERQSLAMIAVQGPNARDKAAAILPAAARPAMLNLAAFHGREIGPWFVARTGYTGEDGLEIVLPADDAAEAWRALARRGIQPAGLGARDTLRLEAGMNLYGSDMDETCHPLESGLAWTVAFGGDRDFIGRAALESPSLNRSRELVGLVLERRGVLRSHQRVYATAEPTSEADAGSRAAGSAAGHGMHIGEVTSGTFSPTLNCAIALARVVRGCGPRVWVDIRGTRQAARVVKPPFVRHGKSMLQVEES